MNRREAIETIKKAIAQVEWDYPMEIAAALDFAIADMKICEANNAGWISVKDRLPDRYGEEYIVYITSNDGEKCVTCDHLVRSSRKHWFLFDDEKAVVTHWMPLPEPPKEET